MTNNLRELLIEIRDFAEEAKLGSFYAPFAMWALVGRIQDKKVLHLLVSTALDDMVEIVNEILDEKYND